MQAVTAARPPTPASWPVVALALGMVLVGSALSRATEPGVRVSAVLLGGRTPALHFIPEAPGPHVLLAHGVTASKETMFRFGEALAAAGFECWAIDLPGHGASVEGFAPARNAEVLEAATREIGGVDVFVGHSMGAYAGAAAVRNGAMRPALSVAVGALPDSLDGVLLLVGRFDEAASAEAVRSREAQRVHPIGSATREARVVISPWSDHALEPYDPLLVNTAVQAACAIQGMPTPSPPTCWRWRLAGALLAFGGALLLGDRLPRRWIRLSPGRGALIGLLVVSSIAFTGVTWLGTAPVPLRIPRNVAAIAVVWVALAAAARLGAPRSLRWTGPLIVTAGNLALGHAFLALLTGLFSLLCLAAEGVARIAARDGSAVQGDIAFAIVVGYALGQWMPLA